jgi:prophage DNA circulation protein
MGIFTRLQKATLSNGSITAEFLFRSRRKDLGRKTVTHEFLNSGSRYVEDLGEFPPVYEIEAEITDTSASQYKRKKEALENVLNTPGALTYIDPFYGRVNVVAEITSVSENITELNVARYTLNLKKSDLNIFPTGVTGDKSLLNRLRDGLFNSQISFFGDTFTVGQAIEAFNDARDTFNDLTTNINSIVSTINGTADEVADFVNDIQDFQNSIASLIQTPSNLATRFSTIFDNISLITDNFEDLFKISLDMVGIGNFRTENNGTSTRLQQINQNKKTTYSFSDVATLTTAFQVATNINYSTQEQLDDYLNRLNDAYDFVFDNVQDDDVLTNLTSIRNQTRIILENIRLDLAKIITIRVNPIPVTVLAYQRYGDTSRDQEILDLNKIEDPAFIEGEIKILSK